MNKYKNSLFMDPLEFNTVKEFGAYFTAWFDWDIDEKSFWLSGLFLPLFVKKKTEI